MSANYPGYQNPNPPLPEDQEHRAATGVIDQTTGGFVALAATNIRTVTVNGKVITIGDLVIAGGGGGGGGAMTAAAGSYAAGSLVDGAIVTMGLKADAAATDSTSSWSMIALLKGIVGKLLTSVAVTQSGTWTIQPGNTANTTAWKVDNSAVTQPVSGTFWQGTQPISAASLPLPTGAAIETGGNLATLAGAIIAGIMQANISKVGGSALGNTNPLPAQDIEQSGYIALTSPPSATNAGSDTALTFGSQVSRVIMQNNTSANVYFAFDVAATLGSLVLLPGGFLSYPKKCTVLHLYTVAAQNINGSAVGGLVVLGAN